MSTLPTSKPTPPPLSTPTPFTAANHAYDSKKHLLLAATGSVATIKLPLILRALSPHPSLSIRLILTPAATHFLAGQSAEQPPLATLSSIKNVDGIYLDADEWHTATNTTTTIKPWTRGDAILHIELRRWADLLVIAPLSANSMAKMVGGWADNLLLEVVRAWDTTGEIDGGGGSENEVVGKEGKGKKKKKKRIIVAPAMNTAMWRHPVTRKQLSVLEDEWGVDDADDRGHDHEHEHEGWIEVLRPVEKVLACGDVGDGAMREWGDVVAVVEDRLGLHALPE